MAHTGSCICGNLWRFETTDLATGKIKGVLHPIAADWEEKVSEPGQGSLMLATRDVSPEDVWPHDTGLYISQVIDGVRVGRWAGVIEAYDADSGGSASVGVQGIDEYLSHRNLVDDEGGIGVVVTDIPQTDLAAALVGEATVEDGIPLVPVADASNIKRQRTYNFWEYTNIGEALQQLTQVIKGVQYQLEHFYNNGFWYTNIHFSDTVGSDKGIHLRGDIEGATYGITVDAKDHATWVYALGDGSEADQIVSVAYDAGAIYPRYHAVVTFEGVSEHKTLSEHAQGYVVDHRDPVATPSMTIPGLDPTPENLQVGDRVRVSFDYGLAKFDGYCKVLSIGWSLQDGSPVTRTLTFQPEVRPNTSIRSQTNSTAPGGVVVPATDGAVFNFQDPNITDSAGMTYGQSN